MLDNKGFWLTQNLLILIFYALGAFVYWTSGLGHPVVILCLVVLAVHIAEIPLAAAALRDKPVSLTKVALNTLLFGFTWWVPAKRGVY